MPTYAPDKVTMTFNGVTIVPPTCVTGTPTVVITVKVDPLDVRYDFVTLKELLLIDEGFRHDGLYGWFLPLTKSQRAAVSAHWSNELRVKIAEKTARERNTLMVDLDDP